MRDNDMKVKKLQLFIITIAAVIAACITDMGTVKAASNDTSWQDEYYYLCKNEIDGEMGPFIQLYSYNGNDSSCHVPAEAVIKGRQYQTYLGRGSNSNIDTPEDGGIWYMNQNIEEIIIDPGVRFGKDISFLFASFSVRTIRIDQIDTSSVEIMKGLFYCCNQLTSLKADFDTSNVTDMSEMFYMCSNIKELDLSGFDTSHVKTMQGMFAACNSLEKLNLTSFDTRAVTNMKEMFSGTFPSGTHIDLSDLNTSGVRDMSGMFFGCGAESILIDPDRFSTSNVTSMSNMFCQCENLKGFEFSGFDTSNVLDMSSMFRNCKITGDLNLSHFDTSKVISMLEMFYWAKCDTLDISSFDFSQDPDTRDMLCVTEFTFIWTPSNVPGTIDPICFFNSTIDIHGKQYANLPVNKKSMKLLNTTTGHGFDCSGAVIKVEVQYANGKKLKPAFTLTLNGEAINDVTYYAYYSNNLHVGTGTVKVVFDEEHEGEVRGTFEIRQPGKGRVFQKDNGRYKIASNGEEVTFLGLVNKKVKTAYIPDLVSFEKKTYKVTAIADKALKNNHNIRTVVIGAYVRKIGANAFKGCKKISQFIVNIKSVRDYKSARLGRAVQKTKNHGKMIIKKKSVRKIARKIAKKKKYRKYKIK